MVVHHEYVYFFVHAHRLGLAHDVALGAPSKTTTSDRRKRYHRWSHIRSADSNCSVFTGFARYSEAPASRHFSRSPFMAFAVRAMIGRRRNAGFCLMTCMVSYPSISGIMISMSTIAKSGVELRVAIAS